MAWTAHKAERATAQRRVEEKRVADLSRYSQQSRWLSLCAEKENNVDNVREAKLKAQQAEEERQRKLLEEKQASRQRDLAGKEMERRMAAEVHRQQKETEKRQLETQRICETSEELKALERKIKTAYVNKERAAQHEEAMLLRKLENDREQAMEEEAERRRLQDIERLEERDANRRDKLLAQKAVLQKQMLEREEEARLKEQEASRDKKMIDDIINKIHREDEMEREARTKKVEETRSLVAQFQKERRLQKVRLSRCCRVYCISYLLTLFAL